MDEFCNKIQQMINNDEKYEIIKILNNLYFILSNNNEKYRKYWTSLYMFDNFVDYIINNAILYRLDEDAKRYFNSYITMNCFLKAPSVYVYS